MLELYFDGACEPINPGGTASYGWVIKEDNTIFAQGNGIACRGKGATNNVAEWEGLLAGLRYLVAWGHTNRRLVIYGDSKLVINQFNGKWRCKKPHLAKLRDKAWVLIKQWKSNWQAKWIRREYNQEADVLSKSKPIPTLLPFVPDYQI